MGAIADQIRERNRAYRAYVDKGLQLLEEYANGAQF